LMRDDLSPLVTALGLLRPDVAWALRRAVSGYEMNGDADALPEPFRSMAGCLARVTVPDGLTGEARRVALAEARAPLWDAMLAALIDRDDFIREVAAADPDGPPGAEPPARPATLADIRKVMAESQWLWQGYIPAARIAGIAAYEGVGKTRFAM